MITRDPQVILTAVRNGQFQANAPASPRGVFMVEPNNFRLNEESARDNPYMDLRASIDPDRALEQYIDLLALIREVGIPVKSFTGDARTPDDIFPNNVFGTAPGRFIVGRMLHPNRQLEAQRQDIRAYFQGLGYKTVDLSGDDCVAELTGPLVIDRARRLGFCGMTPRVNDAGVLAMHKAFDLLYTLQFDLASSEYHTNVVLSVLAGRACVLHAASVSDPRIARMLSVIYGGRVLQLSDAEKASYAGNCIALSQHDLFMSQAAADSLEKTNRALLETWGFRIHSARLDEIEKAGGSLRCMVAEIY